MKKKNYLFGFLLAVSVSSFAQQSLTVAQVPSNVKSTLDQLYPSAANVSWMEDMGYYIPVFTNSGTTTKLTIDLKGAIIHSSVKILSSALPATATSYISSNYANQPITDAEQLTMFNHSTRYEALVGGKDVIFDSNGNFMKNATGPIKQ